MSITNIIELGILAIMLLPVGVILLGVLKNVPGGKKGTAYRQSKKGG
jgi:hypothetical protein